MRTALKKSWEELMKAEPEPKAEPATEPATEALNIDIAGEFIELIESIKGKDKFKIKIIQPGWGSTGFYSEKLLTNAAPKYKAGTQMFIDHATEQEDKERQEGSLRNLAGVLIEDGKWDIGGAYGPGIYADAKVFSEYKETLDEMAPYIGISHRASGSYKSGEAEGRKGKIIEQISSVNSVDFVTKPGAGGKILELIEAARTGKRPAVIKEEIRKEETDMSAEETKALQEKVSNQEAEIARLKEAELLREAKAFVANEIGSREMPTITRTRLIEKLAKNPPVKDGKLDEDAYKAHIKETVDGELDYLAKVTGSGEVRGINSAPTKVKEGELEESFKASFMAQGKSPEEAERLAELAVSGR
ncbi:MAG: hypothetical protein A2Y91_03440 [Chloroflexi bacterium RBG_13_54_8]|nr:MAG: hypothetical protein A2Y91_03440 [Chloroflexi bacterium RBG_13_54_8]